MSSQPGENLEIDLNTFASIIEDQHNTLMAAVNDPSLEGAFLRSMFGEDFLASKDAEMRQYVSDVRAHAAEQQDGQQ